MMMMNKKKKTAERGDPFLSRASFSLSLSHSLLHSLYVFSPPQNKTKKTVPRTHLYPSMYFRVVGAISARIGLSLPGGGASRVKMCSGWSTPLSSFSCSFSSYLTHLFLLIVVFLCLSDKGKVEREKRKEGKKE